MPALKCFLINCVYDLWDWEIFLIYFFGLSSSLSKFKNVLCHSFFRWGIFGGGGDLFSNRLIFYFFFLYICPGRNPFTTVTDNSQCNFSWTDLEISSENAFDVFVPKKVTSSLFIYSL